MGTAETRMDWLVPVVLITATAVVLVLCTRAVRRALREDRAQDQAQDQKLGSTPDKPD